MKVREEKNLSVEASNAKSVSFDMCNTCVPMVATHKREKKTCKTKKFKKQA